ncbi:hypothetical protein OE09_1386 [Flavobacteriaceae bacterium MAR_2010_72]|nr:hypothetical protein OE09_1386 [Flavobacteriaceae bacterium MAR_2010_72]
MEENTSAFDAFELNMSNNVLGLLKETSTWTYFLSILGFIGIGLMVVFGLLFSTIFGSMTPYDQVGFNTGYLGLAYVALALLYFFPVYYLFNFSRKMKNALRMKNNEDFAAAFSNLKSHYKFVGILTIVIISLYVLLFFFALIGASAF